MSALHPDAAGASSGKILMIELFLRFIYIFMTPAEK